MPYNYFKQVVNKRFYQININALFYCIILSTSPFLTYSQESSQEQELVDNLNKKAITFKNLNIDSLYYYSKRAEELAEKTNYNRGRVEAILNSGEYYMDKSQYSKAKDAFDYSLSLSKEFEIDYLEAKSKSKQAAYYYFTGSYDSALNIIGHDVEAVIEKYDNIELASLLNLTSYIYAKQGLYAEALQYRYRVLNLRLAVNDKNEIAKSYNALGDFFKQQNNLHKALDYYISSIETCEQANNVKGLGISMNNIANIHYLLGDYDKSLDYHQKAVEVIDGTGSLKELGISYKGLGLVNSAKGDYQQSLSYLGKAKSIFDEINSLPLYAETLYDIAEINFNQQMYDSALYYWKETERFGKEIESNTLLLDTYRALSRLQLKINNNEDLRHYFEKYTLLADSLKLQENRSQILELQARFENNKFRKQLNEVEDEKVQTEQELADIEIRMLFLILMFGVAVLLIFLVLFFYRKSNKTSKILRSHNKIINTQNNHLTSLNEELARSKQNLEKINETKDRLFAIISHDVRSPLSSLKGLLEIVTDSAQQMNREELNMLFEKLKNRVDVVTSFLDNLLKWARFQDDTIKVNKTSFAICNIVERVVNLYKEQADQKRISIKVDRTDNQKDSLSVFADENMVEFILRNLLANALKFTFPENRIEISLHKTGDFIEISIKDYGVGMTEEECNNLFDFKKQVSKKGTSSETGTGLGLILCKEFVEKNNGVIKVESEYEKGSTFIFTLPLQRVTNLKFSQA